MNAALERVECAEVDLLSAKALLIHAEGLNGQALRLACQNAQDYARRARKELARALEQIDGRLYRRPE